MQSSRTDSSYREAYEAREYRGHFTREMIVEEWMNGHTEWQILKPTLQGYVLRTHEVHGRVAIVKKALADLVSQGISMKGSRVQEDFLFERQILQYLNAFEDTPSGIVELYHSWDDPGANEGSGVHYYLQEFIAGGDLFELTSNFWGTNPTGFEMRDGRRQPAFENWFADVIDIFQQLVHTVSWMHSKGVIHLDISLENIMVRKVARNPMLPIGADNERYIAKLIDFGTAQKRDEGQDFKCTNYKVGKSAYMAPEVFDHRYGPFDGRLADIWSLGVVLFQMLVGSQLYQRASLSDPTLHYAISQGIDALLRGWGRLDSFPEHACDLLTRIFKFERLGRISMDDIVRHEFVEAARAQSEDVAIDERMLFEAGETGEMGSFDREESDARMVDAGSGDYYDPRI